jgi:hypothetical protein
MPLGIFPEYYGPSLIKNVYLLRKLPGHHTCNPITAIPILIDLHPQTL